LSTVAGPLDSCIRSSSFSTSRPTEARDLKRLGRHRQGRTASEYCTQRAPGLGDRVRPAPSDRSVQVVPPLVWGAKLLKVGRRGADDEDEPLRCESDYKNWAGIRVSSGSTSFTETGIGQPSMASSSFSRSKPGLGRSGHARSKHWALRRSRCRSLL